MSNVKVTKKRMLKSTSSGLHTHGRFFSTLMDTVIALTTIYGNTGTSVTISYERTILAMVDSFKQIRRICHNYFAYQSLGDGYANQMKHE